MRLQIFFGPNCACYVVIMAWLRIVLRLYCARNDANANSLMGASALTHNLSLVTHMSMQIVGDFDRVTTLLPDPFNKILAHRLEYAW